MYRGADRGSPGFFTNLGTVTLVASTLIFGSSQDAFTGRAGLSSVMRADEPEHMWKWSGLDCFSHPSYSTVVWLELKLNHTQYDFSSVGKIK